MEISEVRVKLVNNAKERLKAFCSITLENDFVIRDLKIIDGANGIFVAMPSRKLADRCTQCGHKNHLRAHFCNECGKKLGENRRLPNAKRGKLHADIAHPINAACRERIQNIVVEAYEAEVECSRQPGYRPADLDVDLDNYEENHFPDEEMVSQHDEQPSKAAQPTQRDPQETESYENRSGYDDLIAELKRDAAGRRSGPAARRDEAAATGGSTNYDVGDAQAQEDCTPKTGPDESEVAVESKEDRDTNGFSEGIL